MTDRQSSVDWDVVRRWLDWYCDAHLDAFGGYPKQWEIYRGLVFVSGVIDGGNEPDLRVYRATDIEAAWRAAIREVAKGTEDTLVDALYANGPDEYEIPESER